MRIRLYPINQNLTNSDTLLGTDSGGLTKNFQLGTLAQFITSGINVSGTTVVTSGSGDFSLSATLTVGNGLSATSTQLSANPTIGLTTVGSVGLGTKISFDSFGRVISATTLQESDIPSLQPSKIQTTSANRFVTDSQIAIWNANTSVSAVVDLSTSLKQEARKNKVILLSGASAQVVSASPLDENYTLEMSPIFAGQRQKTFIVTGPTSGSYQATVTFLGTDVDRGDWVYPDNCVITTITNSIPATSATFQNEFIVFGVMMTIDSGMVPYPGIYASVEV